MYETAPSNTKQKALASFIVILAVVLVTVGVQANNAKQKKVDNSDAQVVTSSAEVKTNAAMDMTKTDASSSNSDTTASSSGYKDGTYTSSGYYYVPNGPEEIKVTLTLQNGVVTDSQLMNSESDPTAARFQQDFTEKYKSHVVGKNISEIHLSYVAGATDTTQAFNDALAKIKTQAQV